MPVKFDPDTNKWAIGGGKPRYTSKEKADNAYKSYLSRGGAPVETAKEKEDKSKHKGKLG